jgi:histidine triad (HIT) family protein
MEPVDTRTDCYICRKHRGEVLLPGGAIAQDAHVYLGHAPARESQATAYLGYLMLETRRHVPGLEGLQDDEARQVGLWVARASRALVEVAGADHVYAFVIGDHVPHLHVHVVARYPGAPAEYRGPRVDEWPEAPRGGPPEIEALCTRLREWFNAHEGLPPTD